MKKIIATNKAPEAIGPYSQAIDTGSLIFASGQIPIIPETGEIPEGISAQTKQCLENVKAIAQEAGLTMDHIVKVTVFMKDLEDFATMNEIYSTYFTQYPARSTFQVARLPKDALVEVEVIIGRNE